MSVKLSGSSDSEKLASLCQQTYKNQAVWFLNAFWDQFQAEGPKLWKIVAQCADLDAQRHGDGMASPHTRIPPPPSTDQFVP
jgi:hypothetical protein